MLLKVINSIQEPTLPELDTHQFPIWRFDDDANPEFQFLSIMSDSTGPPEIAGYNKAMRDLALNIYNEMMKFQLSQMSKHGRPSTVKQEQNTNN